MFMFLAIACTHNIDTSYYEDIVYERSSSFIGDYVSITCKTGYCFNKTKRSRAECIIDKTSGINGIWIPLPICTGEILKHLRL